MYQFHVWLKLFLIRIRNYVSLPRENSSSRLRRLRNAIYRCPQSVFKANKILLYIRKKSLLGNWWQVWKIIGGIYHKNKETFLLSECQSEAI